ncbi:MAG TPA: Pvc16 family protein [Arachnia sp.]|nr:Pvc16 family protein [Arachnia sp.]HMT85314.1 Pvc16 family protein [Arachnia sp.]
MLSDVSEALQEQIVAAIETMSDDRFEQPVQIDHVVVESPAADLPSGSVASLYLYHVAIDGNLRSQPLLPDPGDPGLQWRPPLPLLLRFLFVPLLKEEDANLLVLGRVVQHFVDNPTFASPFVYRHSEAPSRLRVQVETPDPAELTQLWSALSIPFRLSVVFSIHGTAIESARSALRQPRVVEVAGGYGTKTE